MKDDFDFKFRHDMTVLLKGTVPEILGVVRAIRRRTKKKVFEELGDVPGATHYAGWKGRSREGHYDVCLRVWSVTPNDAARHTPNVHTICTPLQLAAMRVPQATVGTSWRVYGQVPPISTGRVDLRVGCKRIRIEAAQVALRRLSEYHGTTPDLTPIGTDADQYAIRLSGDRVHLGGYELHVDEIAKVGEVVRMLTTGLP